MDRSPVSEVKAKIEYDPKKNYEWHSDDVFSISGGEIDIINRALASLMNTEEYQKFLILQRAGQVVGNFLKEAVEQNLIKEKVVPEEPLKVVGAE